MQVSKQIGILAMLMLAASHVVGQSFIRILEDSYASQWLRTVAISDSALGLCLEDSNRFMQINSCGLPNFSIELRDDRLFTVGANALASDGQGGMVWVGHRQNLDGIFPLVFLHLGGNGSVKAMKQYKLPNGNFYPYSILKTPENHFVVFGNASPGVGFPFRFLLKLDGNGQILAQHFAEGGGIWGGARILEDGGIITRAGSVIYRYDAQLNPIWGFGLPIGGEIYEAPIEVKDGFIIPRSGDGLYGFYLLNKAGALVTGRSAKIDGVVGWPRSFSDGKGGFFSVMDKLFPEGQRPLILQWDTLCRLRKSLVMNQAPATGNWVSGDGFYWKNRNEIRLAGLHQQDGLSKVWIGSFTPGDSTTSCWKPIALQTDTLPDWNLIEVYMPERPVFNISVTNFPYRLFPKETPVPVFACGSARPMDISLGPDTTTCGGVAITLKNRGAAAFSAYRWSTGATSSQLTVSDTGTYFLEGYDGCERAWWKDSITIGNQALPQNPVERSILLCEQNAVQLPAAPTGWVGVWETGLSGANEREVMEAGTFQLQLKSSYCQTQWKFAVEECELAEFPNLISPNEDGKNDLFTPTRFRNHTPGKLEVWNRWGQKIDEVSDFPTKAWKPDPNLREGLYFWALSAETGSGVLKHYSGWVEVTPGM